MTWNIHKNNGRSRPLFLELFPQNSHDSKHLLHLYETRRERTTDTTTRDMTTLTLCTSSPTYLILRLILTYNAWLCWLSREVIKVRLLRLPAGVQENDLLASSKLAISGFPLSTCAVPAIGAISPYYATIVTRVIARVHWPLSALAVYHVSAIPWHYSRSLARVWRKIMSFFNFACSEFLSIWIFSKLSERELNFSFISYLSTATVGNLIAEIPTHLLLRKPQFYSQVRICFRRAFLIHL